MKRWLLAISILLLTLLCFTGCNDQQGQNDVALVIGQEEMRPYAQQIKEALGGGTSIYTANEQVDGKTVIVVGNTGHAQAERFAKGLREKTAWVRFEDDCILVQGGTDAMLQEAVAYFVDVVAPTYKNGAFVSPDGAALDYLSYGPYKLQSLDFDGVQIFEYSIVTKDGKETEDALLLQEQIQILSGYHLPIVSGDSLPDGAPAIVYGSSGFGKSGQLATDLEEKQFLIEADGNHLYLCAYEDTEEKLLTYMFLGKTLECNFYLDTVSTPKLSFTDYRFKFTTAFDGSGKFKSMNTQLHHFLAVKEFDILQGGCTDGEYAYYAMQDQKMHSNTCIILKMKLDTWEIVDQSEPLPIDHANSLTYIPETKQIVAANCDPDPLLISWIDAETLEFVKEETLPCEVISIAYDAQQQKFVGCGKNNSVVIFDKDLNVLTSYKDLATTYTNQGFDLTEDYIFIVSCSSNYIHVCDWDGFWLETISQDVPTEQENMISDGDIHYTAFLNAGADIYMTILYRTLHD